MHLSRSHEPAAGGTVSVRSDVLLWAQRIVAKQGVPAHQLLEVEIDAELDAVQDAFHKIARLAHPDLHRSSLTPEELELVTTAYARIAAAYQELRSTRRQTARLRPLRPDPPPPRPVTQPPPLRTLTRPLEPVEPAPPPAGEPAKPIAGAPAAAAMSSRALLYYRKAELCLRRGDLKGAVLQLKLAIASDPQSAFLRSALAEVEAEVRK